LWKKRDSNLPARDDVVVTCDASCPPPMSTCRRGATPASGPGVAAAPRSVRCRRLVAAYAPQRHAPEEATTRPALMQDLPLL